MKADLLSLAAVVFEVLGVTILKKSLDSLREARNQHPKRAFCTMPGELKGSVAEIFDELTGTVRALPEPATDRYADELGSLLHYIEGLLVSPTSDCEAPEFQKVVSQFVAGTGAGFVKALAAVPVYKETERK